MTKDQITEIAIMNTLDGASKVGGGNLLTGTDHQQQSHKNSSILFNDLVINELQPNRPLSSSSKSHSYSSCAEEPNTSPSASSATVSQQCEQCGKTYKHHNCLSKHQWEHHWAWETTKKICATKHHQVQLLEAAQILIEMQMNRFKRH